MKNCSWDPKNNFHSTVSFMLALTYQNHPPHCTSKSYEPKGLKLKEMRNTHRRGYWHTQRWREILICGWLRAQDLFFFPILAGWFGSSMIFKFSAFIIATNNFMLVSWFQCYFTFDDLLFGEDQVFVFKLQVRGLLESQ